MPNKILTIDGEEGQSIPLILDSPHSGQLYPTDFNHQANFSKLRQIPDQKTQSQLHKGKICWSETVFHFWVWQRCSNSSLRQLSD